MAYLGRLSLLNKVIYKVNLDPNTEEMWIFVRRILWKLEFKLRYSPKLQEFLVKCQLRVENVPERNCTGVIQQQLLQ